MHPEGIVRLVDDLGRVVIPKELRRRLRINANSPVEIYFDKENIVIRKYDPKSKED